MNNTQSKTLASHVQEQVKTNEQENIPGLQNHVPLCANVKKSLYSLPPKSLHSFYSTLFFDVDAQSSLTSAGEQRYLLIG